MESRTTPLILITFFLSLTSTIQTLSFSSTDSFVYGGCTEQQYSPNSPYESNVNSLLTSILNSATYTPYNNFTFKGSTPHQSLFGLYQCRGDLSMPDCAACIALAISRLRLLCSQTCGGALQLEGCYVKYDNITFLGVEDRSVVFKKCGPSIGYDQDEMNRPDSVLAAMARSGGLYRVGSTGDVQGMAQCVSDLSINECQDCLNEAIGRLKSDCGTAAYGDMFLGKCYARYSTNGPVPHTLAPPNNHGETENKSSDNDEGEKTFAIFIGLLAGVALIVIFLAVIRNTLERNGNKTMG